ncbi:autotransporter outer membrane beta-barrel domain-containing protein [Enterobacter chuandaensis]|uniref:autotransporter outer membrane beta-barrel domain-containing protein n=1 Tax=Enterobacter chuandaensis TaxID=2497875 RepID=UPI00207601A5|nr:autotransporter outer membrane beta-barrel domain-containing protein [Enterobacter chuandaensis]MCM7587698.1 autotransporter outer membrane beta-barrel domain-containing protein [Enterobacter chuandaensis]
MPEIESSITGTYNLSRLAIAIRNAIPLLVLATMSVEAATTIPSQTSTYTLATGAGPFTMPGTNTITTSSGAGITGGNTDDWDLTIESGAAVTGANFGINFGSLSGNSVLNLGGQVTTTGTGSAGTAAGVKLDNGGTINIQSTGGVESSSDGIYLSNGGTINNSGSVSGADGGTSVYLNAGTMTYTGDSTSAIGGGYGIIANGGTASVTNAGNIDVLHNGIWFRNGSSGSIINEAGGSINSANVSDYGIYVSASGTVDITNAGSISADTGIQISSSGHTLLNSGSVTGTGGTAISLTGGNNALTFDTGTSITGNITSGASGNTLTLTGGGTLSSNISDLDSITGAEGSGDTWQLNGVISGASVVNQTGDGETILNGVNTYTGGSSVDAGTLNVANASGLGIGTATVNSGGTLELSFTSGSLSNAVINNGLVDLTGAGLTLASLLTGTGESRISALGVILSGDSTGFTGLWNIIGGAAATIAAQQNLGDAAVQLNGTLTVAPASGGYTFTNTLTGSGVLGASLTTGSSFIFDNSVGSAFTGTLQLGQSLFTLSGDNTTALTAATLQLDNNSDVTVGAGPQAIGGLTMNGGTLTFANLPTGVIAASGPLTLTSGTVQVDPTVIGGTGGNLLIQDELANFQLISASGVSGAASNLTLTDLTGTALTTSQRNIEQNSAVVATGTYGYNLNDTNGLGLSYALNELAIQAGQTLTLSGDTTTPGGAADMKALLSGSGNLAINATDAITLTNGSNSFTGTTTVTGGTLRAGAADVIASSSQLTLNSGTTLDLNGFDQQVSNLNGSGNVTLGAGDLTVNTQTGPVTYGGLISGTGGVTTEGAGTWILTGANTWTGGTTITAGILQLGDGGTSGSLADASAVTVNSGATLAFNRSDALALGNTIAGAGNVVQKGSGATTLSGTNTYSGSTTVTAGTLNAAGASALGSGGATVDSGASLLLSFSNGAFSNAVANSGLLNVTGAGNTLSGSISGTGETRISAANTTLSGDNTLFIGNWNIQSGASANVSGGQNLADAAVQLDGTLNVAPATGNYTFTNTLTGTGVMNAVLASGSSFAFDNTVGSAFSGTVQLGQSLFSLSGDNTTALTAATLQLDNNSAVTVGAGTQAIGGLTLNGGTLRFANLPTGVITANSLAINSGAVQIDPTVVGASGGTLLNQDDGANVQLVSASAVSGDASSLTLADLSGTALSTSQVDIAQGGATVAIGTYGYSLNNTGGLGVGYTLNELAIQAGQTLTLSGDTATPAGAADMKALLSGSGNLAINATDAITLTNGSNNFTGTTTVTGGTLRAGAADVIASSSQLTLNSGTTFDLNGFDQQVSSLNGSGNVTLGAGDLTVNTQTGPVTYGGIISGTGGVTTEGAGTWILTGANTWTGGTTITAGTLQLGNGGTTGALLGDVTNNGTLSVNRSVDLTLSGVISGTGQFIQNSPAGGTVSLTGANTWTGATTVQGGTLQLGNGGGSGSLADVSEVTVNSGATLAFNRSNALAVGNTIAGSGSVVQKGSGATTLSGTNTYSGGTSVTTGTLTAAGASALGNGGVTVDSGATLQLSFSDGTFSNAVDNSGLLNVSGAGNTLSGSISGTGENRISAAGTTLSGDNTLFTGRWYIVDGALARISDGQNLGDAAVQLDGTLAIVSTTGNYTFTNTLTGAGGMNVSLASGSSFAFDNTVGSAFTGTLVLSQSQFSLSGDNTNALTAGALQLESGSLVTVGAGTQSIGALRLNGGTLSFSGEVPPGQPDGMVSVDTLTLTSGEVRVDVPTAGVPNPAPAGESLMVQDDQQVLSQLVSSSSSVAGSAGSLTLADQAGNAIGNPQHIAITESGTTVANAGYDYGLSTGSGNDGLYVSYGLKSLDLLSGQTLHLTPDAGAVGNAATLTAQLTGSGNLDVNASTAGTQSITLNNSNNSYTGATTVSGGTLLLGSNNALGATSLLTIDSGATANVNGMTQTIGALGGSGNFAINGGNVTLSNGGTFGGVTSGNLGMLTLAGGTLTLTGANTYTGLTTINSGATLQVGAGGTTGSVAGPVVDNGTLTFNRSDSAVLSNAVSGSGELHQDGAGTLFVTNNVGISGPVVINAGTLSIGDGTTDGTITSNITNNSALAFNRSGWSYGGIISGTGTVEQQSASQTILTGANTYSGNTTVSAGTLNAANASALGTGAATVDSGAQLTLSFTGGALNNALNNNGVLNISGAGNTLNSVITGTGVNRVSALGTTLAGDNSGFSGSWDITSGAGATLTGQQNLGSGSVTLNGLLNVTPASGGFTFINALTGSGLLVASMGSVTDAFNFAASAGNAFTGIVALRRGTLALEGDNISALTNATLSLGVGGIAKLASDQTIGNLTFNGGMLDVAMTSPSTANILTVNNLNVDSSLAPPNVGIVNLQTGALPPGSQPDGNFLDQDDSGVNGIQVIKATTVSSPGKQLTLLLDGAAPVDETEQVTDGFGHDDVLATYGYSAVMSEGSHAPGGAGLYAGYVLKVLNSQSGAVLDTTGANNTTMGAQLTGVGDFEFRAHDGVITVMNPGNNYQGKTLVTSGTLLLGDNNTLGQTSALNIASDATTDLNGYSQTIGALNGQAGSTLALNGGALSITDGGQSAGALTGGGSLTLTGGELVISNANSNLSAAVDVDPNAALRLQNTGALGSGAVQLDGTMTFDAATGTFINPVSGTGAMSLVNSSDVVLDGDNANFSGAIDIAPTSKVTALQAASLGTSTLTNRGELILDASNAWAFNNAMSGSGQLTKAGNGTVTLAGNYGHTGGTHVAAGTLALDNSATALSGGGPVTVDSGAILGGYGTIVGNVTSQGTVAAGDAISSLTGGAGNLTIQGNLDNFNTVNLAGNTVGNTLTVTGNYTAHSTLILNTVLGGDNSSTDKLIVQGDTSGNTDVYVNNKGGSGAQTVNGIRIIEVDGASNGNFILANRVVAGAYDYKLLQGTPTVNDGDWYLRVPQDNQPAPVRPEAGAYTAGQSAAMEMFTHSLHDRLGESLFVTGTGQQEQAPAAWVRIFGSRTDNRSAGQIGQDIWSNGMQLGFDVANNLQAQNRWQIGVMAGYGKARTANKTDGESYVARSDVEGYSVGLYGTWFADARPEGTGPYIDTWMQYGWYDNHIQGEGLPEEKYDSRTQAVSLEGGWAFNVYNTSRMSFFIQPQEQVIYTRYDADDVTEENGTRVKSQNDGGFSNRLGMRVYGYSADNKGRQWKPFIEANWLYNGYDDAVSMDGTRVESDTPRHRYEVKAGLEAKLANQWSIWGNVGTQQGGSDYHSIEGGLGVKYTW